MAAGDYGVATDVGRVRSGNEDSLLALPPMFAVADGMGGANGGEVASAMAVEVLRRGLRGLPGGAGLELLAREADRAIRERGRSDRSLRGMGTTLTAARVDPGLPGQGPGVARIAHVGDSRAYLLRAGRLRRLTRDHTLVDELVRNGQIRPADVASHPSKNVLLNVLGGGSDLVVDEVSVRLEPGDRLLLCTDGVTGLVDDGRIAGILGSVAQPRAAAERLVAEANAAGGHDNATAIVVDPPAFPPVARRARGTSSRGYGRRGVGQAAVPLDSGMSHAQAREILRRAWQLELGRSPEGRELPNLQAVAWLETRYGRAEGQFAEMARRGQYNWGALQRARLAGGVCPVGTVPGVDAGNPRCFLVYPSDLDAARAFVRSLVANASYPARSAAVRGALRDGGADDVAAAMRVSPAYYEASQADYARAIRGALVATGSPALAAAGASTAVLGIPPAAYLLAGGLGLGAYWWLSRR